MDVKFGENGEKRVLNCKVHICEKNCKSYFQLAFFEMYYHFSILNLLKSPVLIKIDGARIYVRYKKNLNFREPPGRTAAPMGTILFLFQAVSKLEQLSK